MGTFPELFPQHLMFDTRGRFRCAFFFSRPNIQITSMRDCYSSPPNATKPKNMNVIADKEIGSSCDTSFWWILIILTNSEWIFCLQNFAQRLQCYVYFTSQLFLFPALPLFHVIGMKWRIGQLFPPRPSRVFQLVFSSTLGQFEGRAVDPVCDKFADSWSRGTSCREKCPCDSVWWGLRRLLTIAKWKLYSRRVLLQLVEGNNTINVLY